MSRRSRERSPQYRRNRGEDVDRHDRGRLAHDGDDDDRGRGKGGSDGPRADRKAVERGHRGGDDGSTRRDDRPKKQKGSSSTGEGNAGVSPKAANAVKKKKRAPVTLSFGDEMEEQEETTVKTKSMDELMTARLKEERQLKTSNGRVRRGPSSAAGVKYVPPSERSLQVVDGEDDSMMSKVVHDGPQCILRVGAAQSRGLKNEMEDTHTIIASLQSGVDALMSPDEAAFYCGVFDGHCGSLAAELSAAHMHTFLAEHADVFTSMADSSDQRAKRAKAAFVDAYKRTEELIMGRLADEGRQDGSAVVTAVVAKNKVFVANAGDCRAVLGSMTEDGIVATRLSLDHKPNLKEEKRRIERQGGCVEFIGVWRTGHERIPMRLAVSRSLGDPAFKGAIDGVPALISYEPYFSMRQLNTGKDLVLVLASDGLWDAVTDQEAVKFAIDLIAKGGAAGSGGGPSSKKQMQWKPNESLAREAAQDLVSRALGRGSSDNVTALCIAFEW